MDWVDGVVAGVLGAYPTVKGILGTLATVLGYGRARKWWNQKDTISLPR